MAYLRIGCVAPTSASTAAIFDVVIGATVRGSGRRAVLPLLSRGCHQLFTEGGSERQGFSGELGMTDNEAFPDLALFEKENIIQGSSKY